MKHPKQVSGSNAPAQKFENHKEKQTPTQRRISLRLIPGENLKYGKKKSVPTRAVAAPTSEQINPGRKALVSRKDDRPDVPHSRAHCRRKIP